MSGAAVVEQHKDWNSDDEVRIDRAVGPVVD